MAPLVEAFHPARLQQHVQYHLNGKARKPPVDLKQCKLKELIQYECDLRGPKENPRSRVVCEPLLRLFRQYVQIVPSPGNILARGVRLLMLQYRCAGGLTVETTSWEDVHDRVK
ncbi:hypothetical protein LTR85_006033 [Meristemomyces frigidus]|nr:hypothetical protein LTR85_006033 [Meristemomyces frigidus]